MKRILLIDVDSKLPNLALMKLSGYYKNKGYYIKLLRLKYNYYPSKRKKTYVDAVEYEKVFVSLIFPINKNILVIKNCNEIKYGGTGYDLTVKLPIEIDNFEEDYSIYPDNNCSYGFITRGCPNNCYFCFVPKKEGLLFEYRSIDQIIKHKQVEFFDNNFLAYDKCELVMEELITKSIKCCFNQGLDIRLINERRAELLSKINYIGEYIFAFDDIKYKPVIINKIKILKKYIKKDWKIKLFIYCNNKMTIEETIDRIEWCKINKCLPYFMRDINCWSSENSDFYVDLAAWCNQPGIFKNMNFKTFIGKRHTNTLRIVKSLNLYYNNKGIL